MKYLFLLLFPLLCFSQWKEEIVTDSIIKETYPIVYNNNLLVEYRNNNLTMSVELEPNNHIKNGRAISIEMQFISDTADYNYITTGVYYNNFIIMSKSVHTEQYFRYFMISDNLEMNVLVNTNVKYIIYRYNIKNFKNSYLFLMKR